MVVGVSNFMDVVCLLEGMPGGYGGGGGGGGMPPGMEGGLNVEGRRVLINAAMTTLFFRVAI